MKALGDRSLPFVNENTGKFLAMIIWLISNNFFRAEYGQQLFPWILKMSTKSPCGFLTAFGNRMFIMADFLFVKIILSQVSVLKPNGGYPTGRISPNRNEPNNVTQQADQNSVLLSFFYEFDAISLPNFFKSWKDITNFAGLKMLL